MIRVHIADDNESVRNDLRTLLELSPLIEIIGESNQIEMLMQKVELEAPNVLILDLDFGQWEKASTSPALDFQESYQAIRQIRRMHPATQIFVLTMHGYQEARQAAYKAGADKFFVKGQDVEKMLELLEHLAQEGWKKIP